ncbi:MOSC domain-containing protein [Poseidonocella sp. HB161398]|uniref:MOSC domain-containing protein n=1 Tax=Poseidonocella sp. HB161398 TaxID=2320855 RepID=UPI001107E322|nr:MOSC domain-containing protein [Poseidonocella sp. HB161398]
MLVSAIGMTPVKCTRFHQIDAAELTSTGIAGDRRFLILDSDGQPCSPARHALFLPLTALVEGDRMTLRYPFGREITGPCHGEGPVEQLDYMGLRSIPVREAAGGWSRHLSDVAGREVRLVEAQGQGEGIDIKPVTLMTTGSLRRLEEALGRPVDPRRFRANLLIDCGEPEAEDGWDGQLLQVGQAVLKVRSSVPRCLVTQLNPETGANDLRTIPALMGYRAKVRMPDGIMPDYATPGFASYAEVVTPGRIRRSDPVTLLRAEVSA